jgi:hypothetical protein
MSNELLLSYSARDAEFVSRLLKALHPRDPKRPSLRLVVGVSECYSAKEEYYVLRLDCGHTRRILLSRTIPKTIECRKCGRMGWKP